MRDTRNSESGVRDENSLAGSGCTHFNSKISGYMQFFAILLRERTKMSPVI